MAKADGSVIIDTRMNTKGFQAGVANMKKGFNGISSSLGNIAKLMAGVFAVKKLVSFGKEAVAFGSDLQEVQNVVDVTFTTMSEKVNEFAKNAAESAGLSEAMAKRYVGTFGAMSKSFGFTEDAAYDMSTSLTQLAGDVASFYNITQDEAYVKLKSVFTGETETLKDLGVVMTQNALDAYAMANGFGKTTQQMTEQEKVALRYRFVMQQLSAASGDFVRTTDSWANQTRILKLQFDSLKATIGQGLINIFTPVLKVINTLLGKLQTLANAFKAFTELITGKKATGGSSGATAGYVGNTDDLSSATQGAQDYADATEDVADATKKANKENRRYLSGLDEVHRYADDSNDSYSPSGSGSAPYTAGAVDYGELEQGDTVMDALNDKMQEFSDIMVGIFKPFKEAWQREGQATIDAASHALSSIEELAKSVGRSLYTVWTNGTGTTTLTLILQIVQNILNTVGNLADRFTDAWNSAGTGTSIIQGIFNILNIVLSTIEKITGATKRWAEKLDFTPLLTSIDNLLKAIQPLAQNIGDGLAWFYEHVLLPIATWKTENLLPAYLDLLSAGISVLNSIIEALKPLAEWLFNNFLAPLGNWAGEVFIGALKTITELLNSFSDWISDHQELVQTLAVIVGSLATAFTAVSVVLTAFNGVMKIAEGVAYALSAAIAFLSSPIGIVTVAIGAVIAVGVLLYKNWDTIKKKAQEIWSAVQKKFQEFITFVKGIFEKDWSKTFGVLGDTLNGFLKNITNIWNSIKQIFSGFIQFLTGTFTGNWKKALNGLSEIFKGVFKGIGAIAKSPINTIISALNGVFTVVNGMISKINSIKFRITIPSWVPGIGGSWFGFNGFNIPKISKIPLLAQGAVIPPNAPFAAVLGDQKSGTNIETPEALLRKVVREETGRNQKKGNGQYVFTAQINRRTLFEEVIQEAALYQSIYGRNPFELG